MRKSSAIPLTLLAALAALATGCQGTPAESEVCVHQKLAALAESEGNSAVIGSWLIDGEPAGMGLRESKSLVTTNTSRFVPHLFR